MNRNRWLIVFIVAGCVFAVVGTWGLVTLIGNQSRISHLAKTETANQACVTKWANATSARSAYLQRYVSPRNDALDALEVARASHQSTGTIDAIRDRFIAASLAYRKAQAKAPLPPPPLLNCSQPVRTTPTDRPSAPGTSTGPRTIPATHPHASPSTPTRVTPTAPAPVASATHAHATPRPATSTTPTRTRVRTVTATPTPPAATPALIPGLLCPIATLPILCPTESS